MEETYFIIKDTDDEAYSFLCMNYTWTPVFNKDSVQKFDSYESALYYLKYNLLNTLEDGFVILEYKNDNEVKEVAQQDDTVSKNSNNRVTKCEVYTPNTSENINFKNKKLHEGLYLIAKNENCKTPSNKALTDLIAKRIKEKDYTDYYNSEEVLE